MVNRIRYIIENWWYNIKVNKNSCEICGGVKDPTNSRCPDCSLIN